MKKLSKINENVFDDMLKRSSEGELRTEEGKKVKTCLGIDIVIKDGKTDYDGIIKSILNKEDPYSPEISDLKGRSLSKEDKKKLKNGSPLYDSIMYLIYDGLYGTSLLMAFDTYKDLDDFFLDGYIPEDDYKAIIGGIATKVREIGEFIKYVPPRANYITKNPGVDIKHYTVDYQIELINENDVYRWRMENEDDDNYLADFEKSISRKFPELEDENFLCWTYTDGVNIAIPFNFNNVMNIKKYREYTENWFKV